MHRSKQESHSITLSARISNDSGTVKPSALAVLRLIHTLELGRLLDWQIGRSGAAEELDKLPASKLSDELNDAWSVGRKVPFLRHFGPLINRRQVQRGGAVDNKLTIAPKEW